MEERSALRLRRLSAVVLLVGCSSATPAEPDAGPGDPGDAGVAICSEQLDGTQVFTPIQRCCHVGETREAAGELTSNGDPGPVCRGECRVGDTVEQDSLRCDCGELTWDGTAYSGPGPCGEGEVCCVRGPGGPSPGPTCMKPDECTDCRPSRSDPSVIVDCCRGAACRGVCYNEAKDCRCGDGPGCEAGSECCPMDGVIACVPEGTCGQGPCPTPPSTPGAITTCCGGGTCTGICVQEHGGTYCSCGGEANACASDQDCCLGPSREPAGQDTFCAPKGTCGQ